MLFSIIYTSNVRIGTYFIYFHLYLKKMLLVLKLVPVLKQQFNKLINERSQTKRVKKSNFAFLQQNDLNNSVLEDKGVL